MPHNTPSRRMSAGWLVTLAYVQIIAIAAGSYLLLSILF